MRHPHIMGVGRNPINYSILGDNANKRDITPQPREETVVVASAMSKAPAKPVEENTRNENCANLVKRQFGGASDWLQVAPAVLLHLHVGTMHRQPPLRPCPSNGAQVLGEQRVKVNLASHRPVRQQVAGRDQRGQA
jgi:hypothetical protein